MGADGKMRTIRKGTNGFTCMPDNPATPGPDPMCMDANAMEWVHAWVAHKAPPAGKVGLMYMLEGGTDASKLQFAPRIGLAWDVTGDGKTSFRAGYGWFYDTAELYLYNNMNLQAPFSFTVLLCSSSAESE